MISYTLQVPWTHQGGDYLVTVRVEPGLPAINRACPGECLPADGTEVEVIAIEVNGNPGPTIDRDLYVRAQESDALWETIQEMLR